MTGDRVFESLSQMTDDERKKCNFLWFADKYFIDNIMMGIKNDIIFDKHIYAEFKDKNNFEVENILNKEFESFNGNEVKAISDKIEDEVSDTAFNNYIDEICGLYRSHIEEWFVKKMKEKNINIITD